jgi:hypothetical protein
LLCDHKEVFYGGAAGGGKSDALLMAALQYVDVKGYAGGSGDAFKSGIAARADRADAAAQLGDGEVGDVYAATVAARNSASLTRCRSQSSIAPSIAPRRSSVRVS